MKANQIFLLVTIADKFAEEKMRELIIKEFPSHGIIGEEFGNYNSDAEYVWVLDPIDGTKSFISGALSFGTLIALLKNGKPIIGVINHPILNEFLIGDNLQTKLNGIMFMLEKEVKSQMQHYLQQIISTLVNFKIKIDLKILLNR